MAQTDPVAIASSPNDRDSGKGRRVFARWAVDAAEIGTLVSSACAGLPLPVDWIETVLAGTRVTATNGEVELLLGADFSDNEILGRPIGEFWPSESRADVAELILAVATDRAPWTSRKLMVSSLLLREPQLTVWRSEVDGRNRMFVEAQGELKDARSRWALRASEERYRKLIHHLPFPLLQVDARPMDAVFEKLRSQGVHDFGAYLDAHPDLTAFAQENVRITEVNHGAALLFGDGKAADLIGPIARLFAPCPETARNVMIAHFEGQRSYSETTRLVTLGGQLLDVRLSVTLPMPPEQADVTLIGVEDISNRLRTEAELRQVQADFSHAARISMLGELAASIAHEINQPLAAIATNADASLRWLSHDDLDRPKIAQLTSRIAASAHRASAIVQRIRDMATKPGLGCVLLDLGDVIHEALQFVRHDLEILKIELSLSLAPDLPPVLGDSIQIQQVIVNLLVNSIQAMSQAGVIGGRIELTLALEDEGTVGLEVHDCGPGIASEHLDRVFDSFFTTKKDGIGIGLGICQSIIADHGGAIRASNHPEGGARLHFSLPVATRA